MTVASSLSSSASNLILVIPYKTPPPTTLSRTLTRTGCNLRYITSVDSMTTVTRALRPSIIIIMAPRFSAPTTALYRALGTRDRAHLLPVIIVKSSASLTPQLETFSYNTTSCVRPSLSYHRIITQLQIRVAASTLRQQLRLRTRQTIISNSSGALLASLRQTLQQRTRLLRTRGRRLRQRIRRQRRTRRTLHLRGRGSRRLLLGVLPGTVIRRLGRLRNSLTRQFSSIAVLFTSVIGFAPLTTRADPLSLIG